MSKKPKLPKDVNQRAKAIIDMVTGETQEQSGKNPAAVALGKLGGLKGGKARAEKLTPEQRQETARRAARSRWDNKQKGKDGMVERISEGELVYPTLCLLAAESYGFLPTAELIGKLEKVLNPQGKDAEILEGRNDSYFSQKVRNMISHRTNSNSFIYQGYADYLEDNRGKEGGLRITDIGRKLIREKFESLGKA